MKECQRYRKMLTDFFYGEAEMTAELKAHLADCSECRRYREELEETAGTLDLFAFEPELDMRDIRRAFAEAGKRQEKKEGLRETLLFALPGLAYLLLSGLIFAWAGLDYFLYYQLYIYLGLPLFIIPLIRARRRGEGGRKEGGLNG